MQETLCHRYWHSDDMGGQLTHPEKKVVDDDDVSHATDHRDSCLPVVSRSKVTSRKETWDGERGM